LQRRHYPGGGQSPRQGDALALAAGKPDALIADQRLIALWQAGDIM